MPRWCDSAAAVLKGELWDYLHAVCARLSTQYKVIIWSAFDSVIRADFEQNHQSRGRSVPYSLTAALHFFFSSSPTSSQMKTHISDNHTHWLTLLMPASWAVEDYPSVLMAVSVIKENKNACGYWGWWFASFWVQKHKTNLECSLLIDINQNHFSHIREEQTQDVFLSSNWTKTAMQQSICKLSKGWICLIQRVLSSFWIQSYTQISHEF